MSQVALEKAMSADYDGSGDRYVEWYRASPADRISVIKKGLSAKVAKRLISDLDVDQQTLLPALKLSAATVNRKASRDQVLTSDESERVAGVATLIGQLQSIVEESGKLKDFNVTAWVSRWIQEPLPALGGVPPLHFLDTIEGQRLVSQALAQVQSGAYA